MTLPPQTVYGQSIPCRDSNHGNCWRRTVFGGLLLECDCGCHRGEMPGRMQPGDDE